MELNREFSDKAKKDFLLIDRAKETGDQKAFAELMSRYKKPVYHMILKWKIVEVFFNERFSIR